MYIYSVHVHACTCICIHDKVYDVCVHNKIRSTLSMVAFCIVLVVNGQDCMCL